MVFPVVYVTSCDTRDTACVVAEDVTWVVAKIGGKMGKSLGNDATRQGEPLWFMVDIASGYLTVCHGKSPFYS